MNTNSNSYTIIYASVMVIIVAFLLMNIFAPLIDYCVVQGNISRREKRAIKSNQ